MKMRRMRRMEMVDFSQQADFMLQGAVNAIKKDVRPGHKIEEPDYLTAIVTKFPFLMNGTWGKVEYGGCFIHKSPQVTFKKGGRCEAGDLLVLCRETIDTRVRYNATLFQLKRADDEAYEVKTPKELVQYEFYTEWPEFSIGGKFNSANSCDINPKTVTPGAQYMFINDPDYYLRYHWNDRCCLRHPCIFTHSIPRPAMISRADLSFGRFLWDFIHWQNGRPIDPDKDKKGDAWSHFIWDMIKKTKQVIIRNVNVGITPQDKIAKQQGDFFNFIKTEECVTYLPQSYVDWAAGDNDGGKENLEEDLNEEENGAISILFIDIQF